MISDETCKMMAEILVDVYNKVIEDAAIWHDERAIKEKDISRSSSMAEEYAATEIRKLKK